MLICVISKGYAVEHVKGTEKNTLILGILQKNVLTLQSDYRLQFFGTHPGRDQGVTIATAPKAFCRRSEYRNRQNLYT